MSAVACGLPILAPLALAFAIPDLILARIMDNSNSAKMPDICKNALVIGSSSPERQSMVILPMIFWFPEHLKVYNPNIHFSNIHF